MEVGWGRLKRWGGTRRLLSIRACLDTTVAFRSVQMAFFLPFQNGKNALFIVETVAERNCPIFTKQTLRRGGFLFPFGFLSSKVLYLFRLICLGKNGERATVRVGGGCADLAEYLKVYVGHHGSRKCYELRIEGGWTDK